MKATPGLEIFVILVILLALFALSSVLFVSTIGSQSNLSTQATSCPPQNGYVDPGCDMIQLVEEPNPAGTIHIIAFVILFSSGLVSLILSIILLIKKSAKNPKSIH